MKKLIYLEKNSYFQNFFNIGKSISNFKIITKIYFEFLLKKFRSFFHEE